MVAAPIPITSCFSVKASSNKNFFKHACQRVSKLLKHKVSISREENIWTWVLNPANISKKIETEFAWLWDKTPFHETSLKPQEINEAFFRVFMSFYDFICAGLPGLVLNGSQKKR